VAIRSGPGTNFGFPGVVVAFTNSTIAFFAALSCQDGRGSDWAWAVALKTTAAVPASRSQELFIEKSPLFEDGRALHCGAPVLEYRY